MNKKQFFIGSLFLMVAAVVMITAVFTTPPAHAATTITVNTTTDVLDGADGLCSLREAVYAANNNVPFGGVTGECPAGTDATTDIITLADGATYTLSIPGVDDDATVSGDLDILDNTAALDVQINVANNGSATIDANDIDRVLQIENAAVELNKIILANGKASLGSNEIGGGLFNNNGILTMNGGEVRSGNAITGGGIYNYSGSPTGGKVTLNGTQVILNGAGVIGGIFSGGDNAMVVLDNAIVRANNTNSYGGGLGIVGGSLVVRNSSINLNSAQGNGGGIYAADSTVTITDSLIEANEATGVDADGGGIYLADAITQDQLTLQRSTIKDNVAADFGGGLCSFLDPHAGRITIQDNIFSGNQASGSGAINTPRAIISGGTFDDNHATVGSSGAIFVISLVITDTVFTNNSAATSAGAIFGQLITATNIRVEGNEAAEHGGGIYLLGSHSPQDISNSVITGNTAAYGGGIYIAGNVNNGGITTISQTAVTNNQATTDGGGIYADESNLSISNSTISSNSSTGNGGGLHIDATSIVTATNITLALNTPGQDLYKIGELTLQNSIIYTPDTPNCTMGLDKPLINSLGNNLTDDASCGGLTQLSDEINVDVQLAPLADNGGYTLTHNLLDGSPAIDTGDAAACAAAPVNNVDQRGVPRPIGPSCDKGAVERGAVIFLPAILK